MHAHIQTYIHVHVYLSLCAAVAVAAGGRGHMGQSDRLCDTQGLGSMASREEGSMDGRTSDAYTCMQAYTSKPAYGYMILPYYDDII
jgi:hypothetical protein